MKVYQDPEMIIYDAAFEAITSDDTPLDSGLGIE